MAVDDYGISGIRKALNEVTPNDNTEYYLATKIIDAIEGSFSPSGLSKEMKVTTLTVSDVASPIPSVNLTDRNSMSIQNKSTTVTIYIGPSNSVTADTVTGTTSGWEIAPESYFSLDIKDDIAIYAICPTGQTAVVKIVELA